MIEYDTQQAQEYERVSHKSERQGDLLLVKDSLRREIFWYAGYLIGSNPHSS